MNNIETIAIILAAGKGTRLGLNKNKMLYFLGQKTILEYSIENFIIPSINKIIVTYSKEDFELFKNIIIPYDSIDLVCGGKTRYESVANALQYAKKYNPKIVLIHDGARINIKKVIIEKCIDITKKYGNAIVAKKSSDTIYQINDDETLQILNRDKIINIQTPQAFLFEEIYKLYSNKKNINITDDSQIYLTTHNKLNFVYSDDNNLKITNFNDLYKVQRSDLAIGCGFDIHPLAKNRKLILGGINIPYEFGLIGHSDADVLIHAIMDALLAASNKKDIGYYFPQTNEFLNANSMELLKKVKKIIHPNKISNLTATILAQSPKLSPYFDQMIFNIANCLETNVQNININATTMEKIGLIGSNKAIAASCVCLLYIK